MYKKNIFKKTNIAIGAMAADTDRARE